ncbi:MAG TPA: hypothetical protein VJ063_18020 [Verrucomicrobiae bacterium]|nr:hypothetical protein [Verrucomicrobiae bacterium]
MILLDALLLEPPKFEVWIALRTDGVLGDFFPGYYGRMCGLDWCLLEDNIIELNIRTIGPLGFNEPAGILIYGGGADPHYRMRQFVARGNLIRNIDNRSDPDRDTFGYLGFAEGVRIGDGPFVAEHALLQSNVVRLDRDDMAGALMTHRMNLETELQTFNNNSPGGTLLVSLDKQTFREAPELLRTIQLGIEDVIVGALLK